MAWYKVYKHISNKSCHRNERGRRWRSEAMLKSSKGSIQKKLSQNSFRSTSILFFISFTWSWYIGYKLLFNMPFPRNNRGRRWRSEAMLRSSKGSIQNKLSQNSFQSMSFLFFMLFTWHYIKDINIFQICLSITTKELGGEEARPCWGAPKAQYKIGSVKIPSKVCQFYLL